MRGRGWEWRKHAPPAFCSPGFGGAAVLIRSGVAPVIDQITGSPTSQAGLAFEPAS